MATFVDFNANEIDAESPITAALMSKYVNDPVALYENTRVNVIKAADSPALTNDATLNNDPDLVVTLDTAGVIWWFQVFVAINTTSNAGFRWKVVTPAETATGHTMCLTFLYSGGGGTSFRKYADAQHTNAEVVETAYGTGDCDVEIFGWVYPSVTGTIQFQWAQGASHGDSTIVRAGSHIMTRCLNYIA